MIPTIRNELNDECTSQGEFNMYKKILSRSVITPFTIALFLIISITGVLMFFHIQSGPIRGLHEWLSIVFVVFGVLHVVVNWHVFLTYLKKPAMIIFFILIAILPLFLIGHGNERIGGNSIMGIMSNLEESSLTHIAPLFGMDESKAIATLQEHGIKIVSGQQTLHGIAEENTIRSFEILQIFSEHNDTKKS